MRLAMQYPVVMVAMLLLIVAEFAWRRAGRGYDFRAALASFGVAIGQAAIRPVTGIATLAILQAAHGWAPFRLYGPSPLPAIPIARSRSRD